MQVPARVMTSSTCGATCLPWRTRPTSSSMAVSPQTLHDQVDHFPCPLGASCLTFAALRRMVSDFLDYERIQVCASHHFTTILRLLSDGWLSGSDTHELLIAGRCECRDPGGGEHGARPRATHQAAEGPLPPIRQRLVASGQRYQFSLVTRRELGLYRLRGPEAGLFVLHVTRVCVSMPVGGTCISIEEAQASRVGQAKRA